MNVMVCGQTCVTAREVVYKAIEEAPIAPTAIGSDGKAGASQAAHSYADEHRLEFSESDHPSDLVYWAEAVIVVGEPDKKTKEIVEEIKASGRPIYVRTLPTPV